MFGGSRVGTERGGRRIGGGHSGFVGRCALLTLFVMFTSWAALLPLSEAATGDLVQKPGTAGCISDDGSGPCVDGMALEGAAWVTISPDGETAYITSLGGDAVAVFDRAADGTLTQKPGTAGCISNDGSGPCIDGRALANPHEMTFSPDGETAYVASSTSDAVAVFDRAADGTLTQKPGAAGCISNMGDDGCADGAALNNATSVTISTDGASVYVASASTGVEASTGAVAVFDRAVDGTLTQKPGTAGCISDAGTDGCVDGRGLAYASSVQASPDGDSVYVASGNSDAVAVFDRAVDGTLTQKPGTAGCISDAGTDGCADGRALHFALSVVLSPDGENVYVKGSDGMAVFDRAVGGALTQKSGAAGCISETGRSDEDDPNTAGACTDGTALSSAYALTASPDGASVYLAGSNGTVAVLERAEDGTVTQPAGTAGCIADDWPVSCAAGTALAGARSVAVSPDGKSAYVAADGDFDAIGAVAVFDRDTDGTRTPPETTITSGPSGGISSFTATFAFTSSESGSTFECRVDGGAFSACTSPHTTLTLGAGAHTFYARAIDQAGSTDPTAATRSFTVQVATQPPPGGGEPDPQPKPKPEPTVTAACKSAQASRTKAQKSVKKAQKKLNAASGKKAKGKARKALKKRKATLGKAKKKTKKACA
jgi:DNA-binding beta-propeller fold protein YncE